MFIRQARCWQEYSPSTVTQNTEAEASTVGVNDSKNWTANEKPEIKFRISLYWQFVKYISASLWMPCVSLYFAYDL
jgi:hypothetical protein